jgi:hypothetical protein
VFLRGEKDAEIAGEPLLPVEPAIDLRPSVRPLVDEPEIRFARDVVRLPVRLREDVVHLHTGGAAAFARQSRTQTARRAVMPLAEGGGEDQDSFQASR